MQHEEERERLDRLDGSAGGGTVKRLAADEAPQTDDDREAEQHDERERRAGEQRAGLLDAAQVGDREQQHEERPRSARDTARAAGSAEVIAATAAEIETATVRM